MSIEEMISMISRLDDILPKNLRALFKNIDPVIKVLKNRYPIQISMIDRVYETGWALGTDTGPTVRLLTNTDVYENISIDEIDELFIDIYSDKSNLLAELEAISYPGNRFNNNIEIMKRLIEYDDEAWKVLLPEMFSMIDRQYVILDDDLFPENTGYVSNKLREKELNRKRSQIDSDIYEYINYKNAELIVSLFKGNKLNQAGKRFNRNTIQHGGFYPENYKYSEFAKLVVLLS